MDSTSVENSPATPATESPAGETEAATPVVLEELLVEEISIDGMCGVY